MAVHRHVEPIKVGFLMDIVMDPERGKSRGVIDLLDGLRLGFVDALEAGEIDRPIELVERYAQGLPRGSVKAVINAFGELADEGCVIVIGPNISENTSAVKESIEERFKVPSISMAGSDKFLGEWTFNLCNGSMSDEPAFIAKLCANAGHINIGVAVERSVIGEEYNSFFRQFAEIEGISIVSEATLAQNSINAKDAVAQLKAANCDAIVHWGFGYGLFGFNEALTEIGWDPPRYMSTAFENSYSSDELFNLAIGWIGLEQYDEANPLAKRVFDRFEEVYGRRQEYYLPLLAHDISNCVVKAVANAKPLSPRGVKEALERIKMMAAASGSPGTRISFGQWTRRGWMGAGYLTARSFTGDGYKTILRGRFE